MSQLPNNVGYLIESGESGVFSYVNAISDPEGVNLDVVNIPFSATQIFQIGQDLEINPNESGPFGSNRHLRVASVSGNSVRFLFIAPDEFDMDDQHLSASVPIPPPEESEYDSICGELGITLPCTYEKVAEKALTLKTADGKKALRGVIPVSLSLMENLLEDELFRLKEVEGRTEEQARATITKSILGVDQTMLNSFSKNEILILTSPNKIFGRPSPIANMTLAGHELLDDEDLVEFPKKYSNAVKPGIMYEIFRDDSDNFVLLPADSQEVVVQDPSLFTGSNVLLFTAVILFLYLFGRRRF